MAKLFYRYAAMNSGKSTQLLQIANNYETMGKAVRLYTAAIDHRGELIAAAAPDTRQTLLATVQGHSGLTPYMRHGNAPVLLLCVALLVLAGGWGWWRQRR